MEYILYYDIGNKDFISIPKSRFSMNNRIAPYRNLAKKSYSTVYCLGPFKPNSGLSLSPMMRNFLSVFNPQPLALSLVDRLLDCWCLWSNSRRRDFQSSIMCCQ